MNAFHSCSGRNASICWVTDIHLDKNNRTVRDEFYHRLANTQCERFVITGDISNASLLSTHLRDLALACAPRPVAFVLGNHDFYSSTFIDVERRVAKICQQHPNLQHLDGTQIIPLLRKRRLSAIAVGPTGAPALVIGRGHIHQITMSSEISRVVRVQLGSR